MTTDFEAQINDAIQKARAGGRLLGILSFLWFLLVVALGGFAWYSISRINETTEEISTASSEADKYKESIQSEIKSRQKETEELKRELAGHKSEIAEINRAFAKQVTNMKETLAEIKEASGKTLPSQVNKLANRIGEFDTHLKAQSKELDKKVRALQEAEWRYTNFRKVIGTQGIKDSQIDIPKLDTNYSFSFPQEGKVIATWCEYVASPGEAGKFYHIRATPDGNKVILDITAIPGQNACRVGVLVHVIYQNSP